MELPDRFCWKPKFMEIRQVGAALILADGRTDIMKILGASRDYSNAPKNNHLSKNSTIITSFSFLMALRHKKTCTAEATSPTICTISCHKCMLITLHCELTYGLPDENVNTAGQVNFLLLATHQKRSKIVYEIQKSGNMECQKR